MDRRTWLTGALGLLVSPCLVEAAPPARVPRIGLLSGSSPSSPEGSFVWGGFFQGLRDLGYVEGQNVVIEGRYYGDNAQQLPAFAADLIRLRVEPRCSSPIAPGSWSWPPAAACRPCTA